MNFSIIVAFDQNRGMGLNGKLPWHLPRDLKHFSEVTKRISREGAMNGVIMGRKTWESLSGKFKPLPKRFNIVLSRDKNYPLPQGVALAQSLDEALSIAEKKGVENIHVIGGGKVFAQAINHLSCQTLNVTEIYKTFQADTFFPEIDRARFQKTSQSEEMEQNGIKFRFVEYKRK